MTKTNFWQQLAQSKEFFTALAPMYDVTDTVFRQVIAHRGRPDVFMTEFVSADALAHSVGRTKVVHLLEFDELERYEIAPDGVRTRRAYLVAQIFGANPQTIEMAATFCANLGFDGIDINMGCPEKNIQKQGSGAALINSPELAIEIVQAAKIGVSKAEDGKNNIPVSIKTRIGYQREEIDTWIAQILSAKPAALTVHLRTKKEMSEVPAHWDLMEKVINLRNLAVGSDKFAQSYIPIIGNGDVLDLGDAQLKSSQTGCDGVMLGRAVFGNPWLFAQSLSAPTTQEKIQALLEHLKLYQVQFEGVKNFAIMKKHFGAYLRGFDGASNLRVKLMEATDVAAAVKILHK
jgi:nifR3 family TIM-barrel protein